MEQTARLWQTQKASGTGAGPSSLGTSPNPQAARQLPVPILPRELRTQMTETPSLSLRLQDT